MFKSNLYNKNIIMGHQFTNISKVNAILFDHKYKNWDNSFFLIIIAIYN
jgi:hypothetical protein